MSSQLGKFTHWTHQPWRRRYGDAIGMVQRCLELEPSHYDAKMLMQDLDRLVTSEQPSGHGAMVMVNGHDWWWKDGTMVDHGDDWWLVMTGDSSSGCYMFLMVFEKLKWYYDILWWWRLFWLMIQWYIMIYHDHVFYIFLLFPRFGGRPAASKPQRLRGDANLSSIPRDARDWVNLGWAVL